MVSTTAGLARACVIALAISSSAMAAGPMKVRQSDIQFAFPNSGERGVQVFNKGQVILDVPLRWSAAATVRDAVTFSADGKSETIAAGTALPLLVLGDESGSQVTAYCTPRRAAERSAERGGLGMLLGGGSLWRGMIRSATDRQLCLIDADGDGRADQAALVNDGSPTARTPQPIAPVAITIVEGAPISRDDSARIAVSGIGRNWAEFTLTVTQQGYPRRFDSIAGAWGTSSRVTRIKLPENGAKSASIFGADFSILAVDPVRQTARIEWTASADQHLIVVIPDKLRTEVRFY